MRTESSQLVSTFSHPLLYSSQLTPILTSFCLNFLFRNSLLSSISKAFTLACTETTLVFILSFFVLILSFLVILSCELIILSVTGINRFGNKQLFLLSILLSLLEKGLGMLENGLWSSRGGSRIKCFGKSVG